MSQFRTLTVAEEPRPAADNRPAAGPVYRAFYVQDVERYRDLGVQNLRELFETSVEEHASRPCLGARAMGPPGSPPGPYEFKTYREVGNMVAAVHGGYVALGLKPTDHVGIIGANAPELMMAVQGLNRMNGVCVPLYDTLGDKAIEYILEHSSCKLVVAQASKLPLIAGLLVNGAKSIVTCGVVYWGQASPQALELLAGTGVTVMSWEQLVARGEHAPVPAESPALNDMCTIMYTSGTTGNPKGVVLSHKAMLTTIAGLQGLLDQVNEEMGPKDVYLSFLTMAHVFDRVAEEFMLHKGASIGYWQGDARKLMDDVDALRPTLFAGVPRVFERIYNGVQDQVKRGSWLKKAIFNYCYKRKKWFMQGGWKHSQASIISDLLVFNKIKSKLGGRVRLIVTGGAPMPSHVEEFLKVTMCAPIVQGYGLTETCAASFITFPYDWSQSFSVGPPMPHTELRLEAVPEMGYDPMADPPQGEVCIRSPGLFSGYYKDEAMTKEVLDADGFFHTGDIGEITPSGALKVIDRMKNLFKLSHGEYIAVERVENVYKQSELVEQIWIYGNSFESSLVAVLVPRESALRQVAQEIGLQGASNTPLKELLSDDKLKAAVLTKLKAVGRSGNLKGFEEIKDILMEEEQFGVENDLMTPSFKLKRPQLLKRYQTAITNMYKNINSNGPPAK